MSGFDEMAMIEADNSYIQQLRDVNAFGAVHYWGTCLLEVIRTVAIETTTPQLVRRIQHSWYQSNSHSLWILDDSAPCRKQLTLQLQDFHTADQFALGEYVLHRDTCTLILLVSLHSQSNNTPSATHSSGIKQPCHVYQKLGDCFTILLELVLFFVHLAAHADYASFELGFATNACNVKHWSIRTPLHTQHSTTYKVRALNPFPMLNRRAVVLLDSNVAWGFSRQWLACLLLVLW